MAAAGRPLLPKRGQGDDRIVISGVVAYTSSLQLDRTTSQAP
jgi:hypothetical protein